jgi:voltage-gated potassium channel
MIVCTVTTVGYGDYHPTDDRSRIFTIFFVLFGLVFIFSIINDFAQSILRYAEKKALEKLDDDPTDLKVRSLGNQDFIFMHHIMFFC